MKHSLDETMGGSDDTITYAKMKHTYDETAKSVTKTAMKHTCIETHSKIMKSVYNNEAHINSYETCPQRGTAEVITSLLNTETHKQ